MVKLTQRMKLAPAKTLVKKALGPSGEPVDIPLLKGGQLDELAQQALAPLKEALGKQLAGEPAINADLNEIRYDALAEAMGAHGERVSSPDQLKPALERALEADRCAVIHVDVDKEKHLWAPGLMHFKDMHQEPKGK
jgi:acetolactate synthase-1/2/3 large subunit